MKPHIPDLLAQLDTQRRKVDVEHFDVTVRELVRMATEGELNIAPEYQRRFRWTTDSESKLIESLFLGLPIPSIFVATNTDGTWELVDGLQRVSTLMHYSADEESAPIVFPDGESLRLKNLEKLTNFNGLAFTDLPTPQQLAFWKRSLRVTALSDKADPNVRFDMFERLNNGGIVLTPMEVRLCVLRGTAADFLKRLAKKPDFRSLVKLQTGRQNDATMEELVLKFYAYLHNRAEFDGAVRTFLTSFMADGIEALDLTEDGKAETLFSRVVTELGKIIDGPLLRRGYGVTPLNQLEAVMVAAGELIQSGKAIRKPVPEWLNDRTLVEFSTKGTNVPSALEGRIARAKDLLRRRE